MEADRHLMAAEMPSTSPDVLIVEATYGVQVIIFLFFFFFLTFWMFCCFFFAFVAGTRVSRLLFSHCGRASSHEWSVVMHANRWCHLRFATNGKAKDTRSHFWRSQPNPTSNAIAKGTRAP